MQTDLKQRSAVGGGWKIVALPYGSIQRGSKALGWCRIQRCVRHDEQGGSGRRRIVTQLAKQSNRLEENRGWLEHPSLSSFLLEED